MNNKSVFSFRKGYSFVFSDEGKEIKAWFSALTGLERIYVDGVMVSSQRNLSKNSNSEIKIGTNDYSTNMNVASISKGPFVCTLYKNGQAYKRQRLVFPKSGKLKLTTIFVLSILIGVLFGIARVYWQFPVNWLYPFVFVIFIVVLLYQHRSRDDRKPIIENEEII